MSSIIEGPLGLSIDQLETIHALVGLRDGKRKRDSFAHEPMDAILVNQRNSFLERDQTAPVQDPVHGNDVDLVKFDSVLEKYREGSLNDGTSKPRTSHDFCFISPDDQEYLSEYLFLLFTQVKKGTMNESDRAKANRASSQLKYGFRCKHCGGAERVNNTCLFSHYIGLSSYYHIFVLLMLYISRGTTSPRRRRISRLARLRFTRT